MINAILGNEMWVAEDRVEEYKAAGHKPVADVLPKTPPAAKPKAAGVKKTTKK